MGLEIRRGELRSRIDIIFAILSNAEKGATKTAILHRANLSYSQLIRYLNLLIHHELIEMKNTANGRSIYYVTDKGKDFLDSYRKLYKVAEEIMQ